MLDALLTLPVIALAGAFARWRRFDRVTVLLLFAALGLYYYQFYHSSWPDFTTDAEAHGQYARHLALHGALPEKKDTAAARHPPGYYYPASLLYRLGQTFHEKDPMRIARHFSMLLYVAFLLTSIVLLRRILAPPSVQYLSAVALLLFWPIGVTYGGRITPDLLTIAAQAGVLYCLALWLMERRTGALSGAFLLSGIGLLAKNIAIITLGLSGAVLALAMYERRSDLRHFLRWDIIASIAFALAVFYFTHNRKWVTTDIVEQQYDPEGWWRAVSSFNLFLFLFDTEMMDSSGRFWNIYLHSVVLGDPTEPWKYYNIPVLLIACNVFWFALILYLLFGFLWKGAATRTEKQVLILYASYGILTLVAMLYLFLISGNIAYADARYMYPVMTAIALAHGVAMRKHEAAGRAPAWRIGIGIAGSFVILTVTLFIAQSVANEHMWDKSCRHSRDWEPC